MDHKDLNFALDTSLERMIANKAKLTENGEKETNPLVEADSFDSTVINTMLDELQEYYKNSDSLSVKTLDKCLKKSKNIQQNTCNECNKVFMNILLMTLHKTWHTHLFYNCMECNSVFTMTEDLLKHVLVHKSDFAICEICRPNRVLKDIRKHFTLNHDYIEYYCTFCKKNFSMKYLLINHLIGVHDVSESNINVETYYCKSCKEYIDSYKLLRKHLKQHENFHHCELCFQMFRNESHLREHYDTCLKFT